MSSFSYSPATPPPSYDAVEQQYGASKTYSSSSSYNNSCVNVSPADSIGTQSTSPPRSPGSLLGPLLLPKIRSQDQNFAPQPQQTVTTTSGRPRRHRSTRSTSSELSSQVRYPYGQQTTQLNAIEPSDPFLLSPASASSVPRSSRLGSPITLTSSHSRNSSTSSRQSRSSCTSDLNEYVLTKFCPSYQQVSTLGPASQASAMPNVQVSSTSDAFVHSQLHSVPFAQTCLSNVTLPAEFRYKTYTEMTNAPHTNLITYLTSSTAVATSLVRQVAISGRSHAPDFWWDVRNLEPWDTFSFANLACIPDLLRFLRVPIKANALPTPVIAPHALRPDSDRHLAALFQNIYATRVNAALRAAMGNFQLTMHLDNTTPNGPMFLATYPFRNEATAAGNRRGHVVGLVKTFEAWNTGMRNEENPNKVRYLSGLAQLHRCMREHMCRYGFIITEIELVCVRLGTEEIPFFGHLQVSVPIETKTSFAASGGEDDMDVDGVEPDRFTVALALFYVHLLSKDCPLFQEACGRVDFPAGSRGKVLEEKDAWIPDPQIGERRKAKQVRGWVWPQDPFNRKEHGGRRRKV